MELKKERVQILRVKSEATNQITFDEDYNVPDVKPDIGRMIQSKGEIQIEEVKLNEDQAFIRAKLCVDLLYVGEEEEGRVYSLSASLPIEETLNLEGIESGDKICLKWEIEDLSLHVINSRKLNIKALVTFFAVVDELGDIALPVGIEEEGISCKKKNVRIMGLRVHKKDTMRLKEEIPLASNKPNIHEILWHTLEIRGVDLRPDEDKVSVKGELFVFVLYEGDDEGNPLSTKPYTRFEEGQSTSAIWAVRSLGIDPASGEEMFIDRNGYRTYVWNVNDQVVCGEANPKFQGNFGFNAEWRGLAVNCSFAYKAGGEYYNQTLVDRVENVDVQWNVDRRVFTGTWKEPGDRTFFKRVESTPTQTYPTSRFVEKSNELSLSSLNVSYDFKRLNVKRYVERLKIAFYMTDVFRVSTVKAERGLEYPFARTCSFSLQATF